MLGKMYINEKQKIHFKQTPSMKAFANIYIFVCDLGYKESFHTVETK